MSDRLKPENCNKSHCKTCIFHPNIEQRVHLSKERISQILTYLSRFESSHICHQTNLTCYGALEFQAKILFGLGFIKENSVDSLLESAKEYIK